MMILKSEERYQHRLLWMHLEKDRQSVLIDWILSLGKGRAVSIFSLQGRQREQGRKAGENPPPSCGCHSVPVLSCACVAHSLGKMLMYFSHKSVCERANTLPITSLPLCVSLQLSSLKITDIACA